MRIAVPFAINPPLFVTLCWMDCGDDDDYDNTTGLIFNNTVYK